MRTPAPGCRLRATRSVEVSATPTGYPGAPIGLSATSGSNSPTSRVDLNWTATHGAESYNVYRSIRGGAEGPIPIATGITDTSFTDAAAAFGVTYFYQVTAVNATGEGPRSAEVHVTPTLSIHINFTASDGDPVANYLADTGQVFGMQTSGFAYGWTRDDSLSAVDRNAANSPDEVHDSFHEMQARASGNARWHIALPNGTYLVHILMGDPNSTDGRYRVNAKGGTGLKAAVRGQPTADIPWVENTITLKVLGGKIWVLNAAGARANTIDAIDIEQILPNVNLPTGFAGAKGIAKSGSARLKGESLRLTNGNRNQAGSAFTTAKLNVASFRTEFDFQLTNASADGFAFVLQANGPHRLGVRAPASGTPVSATVSPSNSICSTITARATIPLGCL